MIITNKINAYIHQNGEYRMDAVQGDSARVLELTLYAGASEWTVPEGTSVQVRFRKPDGTGGYYDTLPDGTCAYQISGNAVTVALAPQVLTVAGAVEAQVLLCWSQGELATFTVCIRVQADPSLDTLESEDYVNLSSWVTDRVKSYLQEAQEELRALYAPADATFVHVYKSGDSYVADKTYEEIVAEGPFWEKGSPKGGSPVFCVFWWPSGREYAVLSLAAHDPATPRITFSRIDGNGEYWVTIRDTGVDAGWTQMARSQDIPKSLPNPNALTVGGQSYDGSEAVEVDLGPLVVSFDWDGILTDRELSELYEAYQLGRPVCFFWEGCLLPTVAAAETEWTFSGLYEKTARLIVLGLNEDGNTVVTDQREWELSEKVVIGDNGNWWIGGVDTGAKAAGEDGLSIHSVELDKSQSDETKSVYFITNDGDATIGTFTVYHGKDAELPLYVTVSADGLQYSSDTTYAEIRAARDGGREVYCLAGEVILPMVSDDGDLFTFGALINKTSWFVSISADDSVHAASPTLAAESQIPTALPNPSALTINGVSYDGSEAVEVELTDSLPDYWTAYLPDRISAIQALQDEGGKDSFGFIVMADPHHAQLLAEHSPKIARYIQDRCGIRHVLVLGDFQNRGAWSTKEEAEAEWTAVQTLFEPLEELRALGNHDGSWGDTLDGVTYPYNYTPAERYNRVLAKTYRHHNAVTDATGTAYYVDDDSRKVRYIVLNTHCNEYAVNDDGSAVYSNMSNFRFTQAQYDFLTGTALQGLGEDWAVVVAAHAPISNTYASAFGGDSTAGDHIVMRGLLTAFKNKTSYSGSFVGTAEAGAAYTNLADPESEDWAADSRINSSGAVASGSTGNLVTNYIPCAMGDVIRIKGLDVLTMADGGNSNCLICDADKANLRYSSLNAETGGHVTVDGETITVTAGYYNSAAYDTTAYMRFCGHLMDGYTAETVVITVNEEIAEGERYDAVEVEADFTEAKGELVGYFCGHCHNDYLWTADNGWGIDIISTRCDSANENDAALLAERVAGTVTEHCFDVFIVNKNTRTVSAIRIGAGEDRSITY